MASSNTSKTAHVMNLLSKNRGETPKDSAEPTSESQAAAPQAAPAAPAAPVAPIISSITADAAVSSQIKDALEAELEETPKDQPAQQPVQRAAPAAPAQQPAPPAPEPAPMDLPVSHGDAEEEHPSYINVMQILVDEKADEYMKMFGICCCEKCRVDVRAYALNHLPPKYVVMSENERVPRLTVYESRFASDITAQLIQACKQVMLTPHHSRSDN